MALCTRGCGREANATENRCVECKRYDDSYTLRPIVNKAHNGPNWELAAIAKHLFGASRIRKEAHGRYVKADFTEAEQQQIEAAIGMIVTQSTWAPKTGTDLRALILKAEGRTSTGKKTVRIGAITDYERNSVIHKAAIHRSAGLCEYCEQPARFFKKNGEPRFQTHHIVELSKGGADSIWSVAAIHPDCHDAAHHSKSKKQINAKLVEVLASKKAALSV